MISRHVMSFSTTRINLLSCIVVTLATSHWLRSPLKAEAAWNTVAKKEGRIHSDSTRKKRRRKEDLWSKILLTVQRRQTQTSCTTNYSCFFSIHMSPHHTHLTPFLPNSLSYACLCIIFQIPRPKPPIIWNWKSHTNGKKSMKYHHKIS